MPTRSVQNKHRPLATPLLIKHCTSFWDRFLGLMFRPELAPNEGILLDEGRSSRINTAIHMLFMNFDIAAIWLDAQSTVVDLKIAPRWSLAHIPAKPAQMIMEIHPSRLNEFQVGDQLEFEDA